MQLIHDRLLQLPAPEAASARHSERVTAHIQERIRASGGDISFAEFMQYALYAPGLGYYSAGARKFGAAGDFVTAPEVSPLFGRLLATQCAHVLQQVADGQVLEPGAGSGALAVDLLRRLKESDALPDRYLILEVSADLAERQQDRLRREIPDLFDRVVWLPELPRKFSGVVVANEVADALPVERFLKSDGQYFQYRVASEGNGFVWRRRVARENLRTAIRNIEEALDRPFADGYESEVSLGLGAWIRDLANVLDRGFIFLFDYGASRREIYAAERRTGWLRCHFRHRAHDDPLVFPGIQDLTTWVDFTAVAEAAAGAGMTIAGFVTQAQFLIAAGLENELAEFTSLPSRRQLALSREIKLLTLPTEMGENFKCLGMSCGKITSPPAFANVDLQHAL
jgi:SAM-dependent MidA family methyltransferase